MVAKSARPSEVGLEAFSRVVEAIYDCALDPLLWEGAVRMIGELLDSQRCALGVYDYKNGRSEVAYYSGYEEHFLRLHDQTYSRISPLFAPTQMLPVGAVATQSMLIDEREFIETRYYQEWVKPQALHDAIAIKVLQTGQRIGLLAANRAETHPRYGDAELRLLTLLSPHVCRAVAISDALNLKTVRSEALESTLDALTSGVFLADRYGRIVYMNRAAERQARSGNAIRVEDDRLAPIDRTARLGLAKTIAEIAADESEAPSGSATLALPGRGDPGLVATVLPLTRGERRNVCGAFAASVAIFVQDPVEVPPFPGEAFAKLYGLTGGELRVLLAMAPGLSVREAAEVLGIGETTAKTHLQHIYEKTGTSKQTELMNLFMNSAPPVKPR